MLLKGALMPQNLVIYCKWSINILYRTVFSRHFFTLHTVYIVHQNSNFNSWAPPDCYTMHMRWYLMQFPCFFFIFSTILEKWKLKLYRCIKNKRPIGLVSHVPGTLNNIVHCRVFLYLHGPKQWTLMQWAAITTIKIAPTDGTAKVTFSH